MVCAGRSRCCRRSSSSAPARWTSRRATPAGGGSGPACWPRSTSARPPATCGSARRTTARTSAGCASSWTARKRSLLGRDAAGDGGGAAGAAFREGRPAPRRDQALETLNQRGDLDTHAQPEVFPSIPRKGSPGLQKLLRPGRPPRTIDGVDIAHLGGTETVAALVQFIDGLPFKPGYRRIKIRTVQGVDDFASIREVVSRRFQRLQDETSSFPDILLIDGGKGQLDAALAAFEALGSSRRPYLAGQARGGDLRPRPRRAARLSRHVRPAAVAIRPRRGPPLRPALSPHAAARSGPGRAARPARRQRKWGRRPPKSSENGPP